MNKWMTVGGIGAALVATAVASGLGVAFAHDPHDGEIHPMNGAGTQMTHMMQDPAAMDQHMKEILGIDAFAAMKQAMQTALGADGYEQMLERMAAGCADGQGNGMMAPGSVPAVPGHSSHHSNSN
jgi:hypothetical protein